MFNNQSENTAKLFLFQSRICKAWLLKLWKYYSAPYCKFWKAYIFWWCMPSQMVKLIQLLLVVFFTLTLYIWWRILWIPSYISQISTLDKTTWLSFWYTTSKSITITNYRLKDIDRMVDNRIREGHGKRAAIFNPKNVRGFTMWRFSSPRLNFYVVKTFLEWLRS